MDTNAIRGRVGRGVNQHQDLAITGQSCNDKKQESSLHLTPKEKAGGGKWNGLVDIYPKEKAGGEGRLSVTLTF